MTNAQRLNTILYGVKVKLKRGEDLETILKSYVKLNDEEKDFIRNNV